MGLLPEGPPSKPSEAQRVEIRNQEAGMEGGRAVCADEILVIWAVGSLRTDWRVSVGRGLLRLVSVVLYADTFQSFECGVRHA